MIFPDTSPRGVEIEGIRENWWFGEGAGYYLNATEEKYSKHFNMYTYVTEELPKVVETHFPVDGKRKSVTGMSMGGLGALTVFLRNPGHYRSVSAFCPIGSPSLTVFGQNAFKNYLGSIEAGAIYDPCHLVGTFTGPKTPILIDQGSNDKFLKDNLKPEEFLDAAHKAGHEVEYRVREGYSHDFFFTATFIEEHIEFHARYLKV